jgi:hypothetical protein
METAGTVPRGGVQLEHLAELIAEPGPFLSVYLVTEAGVDNAAQRSVQRWKPLRQDLATAGAPEAALEQVDRHVPEAHLHGGTLAVIVAGEHTLVEHLDAALERDRGSWARLPDVVPLVRWQQDHPPFVVALADRGGADLLAHQPGQAARRRVAGDGDPERKVAPGGWSQSRFQRRAEDDWAHTATAVAERIARLSDEVDARIVVLGGDVRAKQLILDHLPPALGRRTHVIDPGRAADGSEEERAEEIRRLVSTSVAEDTVALLEKFKEELGQHDRAVEGIDATIDALNRAAVDVLLLHDDLEHTVWVGAEPVPIGVDPADAMVASQDAPQQARLADALVRGAVGTGASVRIVPRAGPMQDGIGALLRWSTSQS